MNDDTHTHAFEAMSSATSGLGIQALCIFKEPSKAPAGMFAEACADAERRKSSFFQPYATSVLVNLDVATPLSALTLVEPDARAWRDRVATATTSWDTLSATFQELSHAAPGTASAANELVDVHTAIELAILDAIRATNAPAAMLCKARKECDKHDEWLRRRRFLMRLSEQ